MLKVVREDISQNAVHRVGKNFSSPWREIAGRKAILICLVSEKRAETAALIALLLEAGEAKTPRRNCSIGRRSRKHHFFRARFYRSTKIRFSLILPLRESCWGVPSPNPAYAACAAEKSLKIIFRIFQKQFRFTPCFSPISERTPRTAERLTIKSQAPKQNFREKF